ASASNAGADDDRLAVDRARFLAEADAVTDRAGLDALRVSWLGRKKGRIKDLMGQMKSVPADARRAYGQAVNALKQTVDARLAELTEAFESRASAARAAEARIDLTLPGRPPALGGLHPVTRVTRTIESIFASLGYSVAEGPEVEDDVRNFEKLNIPADHPARDDQDTFFLDGDYGARGLLLRTHTSPVQVRTMLARNGGQLPIRVICPGRVYRNDNDLRHSPMFHQVECLAIAEGLTVGDLKGTLEAFLQALFTPDTQIRLRPSFFPFTEPSAEVDITCPFCGGSGTVTAADGSEMPCPVCSGTGWIEILGCGMVDPRVLDACGIDPAVYSGFAFGLGLDRVAMIRYDIPNIRMLFDNDERLLRQVQD
ncbi:MAG: phenylalanine--tRNA ligase subunit alpha, partial [Acidobacteriota bacterium]